MSVCDAAAKLKESDVRASRDDKQKNSHKKYEINAKTKSACAQLIFILLFAQEKKREQIVPFEIEYFPYPPSCNDRSPAR